jgi:hypothetical protein
LEGQDATHAADHRICHLAWFGVGQDFF